MTFWLRSSPASSANGEGQAARKKCFRNHSFQARQQFGFNALLFSSIRDGFVRSHQSQNKVLRRRKRPSNKLLDVLLELENAHLRSGKARCSTPSFSAQVVLPVKQAHERIAHALVHLPNWLRSRLGFQQPSGKQGDFLKRCRRNYRPAGLAAYRQTPCGRVQEPMPRCRYCQWRVAGNLLPDASIVSTTCIMPFRSTRSATKPSANA